MEAPGAGRAPLGSVSGGRRRPPSTALRSSQHRAEPRRHRLPEVLAVPEAVLVEGHAGRRGEHEERRWARRRQARSTSPGASRRRYRSCQTAVARRSVSHTSHGPSGPGAGVGSSTDTSSRRRSFAAWPMAIRSKSSLVHSTSHSEPADRACARAVGPPVLRHGRRHQRHRQIAGEGGRTRRLGADHHQLPGQPPPDDRVETGPPSGEAVADEGARAGSAGAGGVEGDVLGAQLGGEPGAVVLRGDHQVPRTQTGPHEVRSPGSRARHRAPVRCVPPAEVGDRVDLCRRMNRRQPAGPEIGRGPFVRPEGTPRRRPRPTVRRRSRSTRGARDGAGGPDAAPARPATSHAGRARRARRRRTRPRRGGRRPEPGKGRRSGTNDTSVRPGVRPVRPPAVRGDRRSGHLHTIRRARLQVLLIERGEEPFAGRLALEPTGGRPAQPYRAAHRQPVPIDPPLRRPDRGPSR